MTAQYPPLTGDPLLQIKLDWMDGIKISEPIDTIIPINIHLHDDVIISTNLNWKGSVRILFAEFAATYIFCKDTFKSKMSKSYHINEKLNFNR